MSVKIRSREEDFKVEEIAQLPLSKKGDFGVYILEKQGWNTLDLLLEISDQLKIPFARISYGGRKDRHAVTRQYIAVQGPKLDDFRFDRMALTFCGYMDRPMGPDLIEANRFEITVRDLSADRVKSALDHAEGVKKFGFPNYFDDQRFGSFDVDQGFLAEKLLLGHLNGAVKIVLTGIYSKEKQEEKDRKRFFIEHWKDWKACQARAVTEFEKFAFEALKGGEKNGLVVLNAIPKEELSMYFSAYQSYLWNEVAQSVIRDKVGNGLKMIEGVAGKYLFYDDLSAEAWQYFKDVMIPTAAHNTKMPDEFTSKIYAQLLESRGVKKPMFNKLKVRKAFFKATERVLIVQPKDLIAETAADELYPSKQKIVLKFTLPRGSYATMLVKRLFHRG